MRHFPIFLDTRGRTIVVAGAGECAVAKLRLLLKTEARIDVYGANPTDQVTQWAREGRLTFVARDIRADDVAGAALLYAAQDDDALDQGVAALGRAAGVKTLIVDNLDDSDFITPAIVDRDPVTVAIGTEGTAPVLARKIKADIEATLPPMLGMLARIGQAFRPRVAGLSARARRAFWARYYYQDGPLAAARGEGALRGALDSLLAETTGQNARPGHVHVVGAGPGDPELLTLRARKHIHDADIVIHDQHVSGEILELARREARLIEAGMTRIAACEHQQDIPALLAHHGATEQVVRLVSGDGGGHATLHREIAALDGAGVAYGITPGIAPAAAALASLGAVWGHLGGDAGARVLTTQQVIGLAAHDWRALAAPGAGAAIYVDRATDVGRLKARMLAHGMAPDMPVALVEHASCPAPRSIVTTLVAMDQIKGDVPRPAVLLLGLRMTAENTAWKEAM